MEWMEKTGILISQEADFEMVWNWLQQSVFGGFLTEMQDIMQNPEFHGEGNVYTHTGMVCEALYGNKEFRLFSVRNRPNCFWRRFCMMWERSGRRLWKTEDGCLRITPPPEAVWRGLSCGSPAACPVRQRP